MKSLIKKIYLKIIKRRDPIKWARTLGVKVGEECRLIDVEFSTEPYLIKIGNRVSATKTRFETHDGAVWVFRKKLPEIDLVSTIEINDNVYLGYGVIILPGTKVGKNVIIGAGSLLKGVYESDNVYAGVPAKKICSIEEYKLKNETNFDLTKSMKRIEKQKYYEKKFFI